MHSNYDSIINTERYDVYIYFVLLYQTVRSKFTKPTSLDRLLTRAPRARLHVQINKRLS